MALNSAIPVRFSPQTKQRLEAVRAKTGVPVTQLIRLATLDRLDVIERTGKIEIALQETYPPGKGSIVLSDDSADARRALAAADKLDAAKEKKRKGRKA